MTSLNRRSLLLTVGTTWALTACSQENPQDDDTPVTSFSTATGESKQAADSVDDNKPHLDHNTPDSIQVLVNKVNPLEPKDYAPTDLVDVGSVQMRAEAAEYASQMIADGNATGLSMTALSGYRSYETQVGTYNNWVSTYGQEKADTASARPGYSEHQTGLAIDVGSINGDCNLQVCFADTPESQWLAENCHSYGFVLRFPYWQHEITGYWYESWHFRYIGKSEAQRYKDSQAKNLESFWGFEPAPNYAQ